MLIEGKKRSRSLCPRHGDNSHSSDKAAGFQEGFSLLLCSGHIPQMLWEMAIYQKQNTFPTLLSLRVPSV